MIMPCSGFNLLLHFGCAFTAVADAGSASRPERHRIIGRVSSRRGYTVRLMLLADVKIGGPQMRAIEAVAALPRCFPPSCCFGFLFGAKPPRCALIHSSFRVRFLVLHVIKLLTSVRHLSLDRAFG